MGFPPSCRGSSWPSLATEVQNPLRSVTSLAIALTLLSGDGLAHAAAYAVVVGNNAPPRESVEALEPLRFADDDAVRFWELFRRMRARVELLSVLDDRTQRRYPEAAREAREPSIENLRQVMHAYRTAMAGDLERGDEVHFFFTYSGHGARSPSGEAFLTMSGGELTESVLFDEILEKLPASYGHLIVDSCNATGVLGIRGFFGREVEATPAPIGADEIARATRLERLPTLGAILASTEGNASHEWSQVEAGVFTHEILSALSGAADINRDQVIEYSEVHAFVAAANRDLEDPRSMPQVVARPPRINRRAPLVSLRELDGVSFLRGSPGLLGRFFIELANGQRYLDAHLASDVEATVMIPAGAAAYLRGKLGEALLELDAGSSVTFEELSYEKPRAASRGSIEKSFHERLFASPYNTDYYRGFVDRTGGLPVDFLPRVLASSSASKSPTVSLSLAAAAGAFLVTSGIAAYVAWRAERDFDGTVLQRPARLHAERYRTASGVALGAAGAAVLSGLGAWILWPEARPGAGGPTTPAVAYTLNAARTW